MTLAINRGSSDTTDTSAPPLVSVVIVNWNVCRLLRDCLRSLERERTTLASLEVIVVDNESADGSADMVRAEFPWVRLIESGGNIGYSRGNNLGLRFATGQWLLLLNPDTVVLDGSLGKLLQSAQALPDVGALAPLQFDGDERVSYESAVRFPTLWNVLCDFTLLSALFPRSRWFNGRKLGEWRHDDDREVPAVSGAAMLMPRAVWEQVGGLDEAMFCVEDMDYCRRVRAAGWKIWYIATAPIVHYGRSSMVQQGQEWQRQAILQSFWVYRRKHAGTVSAYALSVLIFLWSLVVWCGLTLPALVAGRHGRLGARLNGVRDIAASLLTWSLCNKLRFRHPFSAGPLEHAS